jgi:hypothetical protein
MGTIFAVFDVLDMVNLRGSQIEELVPSGVPKLLSGQPNLQGKF